MQTELRDSGWNYLKRSLRDLAQHQIVAGILDNEELALIAQWLEYGTPDADYPIPERPAHRACFEKNKLGLRQQYAEKTKLVMEGKISKDEALRRIAAWYAGKLRWEIINYNAVPNAPATVKAKGFNDPLIDSGDYVNQIEAKVRKNAG